MCNFIGSENNEWRLARAGNGATKNCFGKSQDPCASCFNGELNSAKINSRT